MNGADGCDGTRGAAPTGTLRSAADDAEDLGVRPLTARSVVLSTLLGNHPAQLPVRALVRIGELFGIAEGTVRVALSRMVAAGDLTHADGDYALTSRLLARQRRQDDSRTPRTLPWTGVWEIALVTGERRTAAERTALRRAMDGLRLAELREGSWLRPANLDRPRPAAADQCTWLTGTPDGDPVALAGKLWDLDGWAARARDLDARLGAADDPAHRFTVAAAAQRHLLTDPLLPADLLPADWPGGALRQSYDAFVDHLRDLLRHYLSPVAAPTTSGSGTGPAGAVRSGAAGARRRTS
ncbi:PaaX family transcriptional regulator C-terminal domain-containing protein [Streptomyces benahoarensis]|uniref:PaaX domain-containing protein, C-domain protein n=1 Tax=Streptomyces benahoarensis TaxID=2595054 RepID=A0A553ZJB7_9ACTN|nr:PaaX family transcriptional regulator C-terminal domain-containing protein [Streptomyces benahoarensis]TSB28309.1 PaaX domain-containing protein, C- domain protein [Streptomyces benahoarensis]TSB41549.1 PaaX domain-containing protein, C- domain protein [Streptomyces benahoarensis]